jgi:hypothetical protein
MNDLWGTGPRIRGQVNGRDQLTVEAPLIWGNRGGVGADVRVLSGQIQKTWGQVRKARRRLSSLLQ